MYGFRRSPAAGFSHWCMLLLCAAAVRCGSPRWRCRCSSPMGCVDYHDSTRRRGLARDAPGRPSLACLTTSGGEWVERKKDSRSADSSFALTTVFEYLHGAGRIYVLPPPPLSPMCLLPSTPNNIMLPPPCNTCAFQGTITPLDTPPTALEIPLLPCRK
jgi:hypothetical protein